MARINWEKPQLIVISRGTPEESVLAVCKFTPADPEGGTFGPGVQNCRNPGQNERCSNEGDS